MGELGIFFIVFACIFGGVLLGMLLRAILPQHHLNADSKDVIKVGTGMIATLTALVVGLLIASAKGNFDSMNNGLIQTGSKIILLDRLLAQHGPEADEARGLLRTSVGSVIKQIWPNEEINLAEAKAIDPKVRLEAFQKKLWQLSPQNEAQRWLRSQALQETGQIAETRWLLFQQVEHSSLPTPFFVIVVAWLVIIFLSLGLFTPRNVTVIVILILCALSAAGSLYLIQELDHPFGGLIQISSEPFRNAYAYLSK